MNIIETLKAKAAALGGRIVLPESHDERMLRAADAVISEALAEVILVGDPQTVRDKAGSMGLDPAKHPDIEKFANYFYEKRKEKGVTPEQARQTVLNELFFGAMLVKFGLADGMVAGAVNTTADVLRSALQVVGVAPGLKTVSSSFIMLVYDYMGEDRIYLFADCAVVPNPDPEQLADIAISTAHTRKSILGDEPRVALLSFSTMGSAKH